jgi:predicted esterase
MIGIGFAGVGATLLPGCAKFQSVAEPTVLMNPILNSRPSTPKGKATIGTTVPYSNGLQDALLYVPAGYVATTPTPLVLMLHDAGAAAITALSLFQPYADAAGLALLAVDSYSTTWDIIGGDYGPDVEFIDASLAAAFNEVNVDPTRVTVEGFSDGASYALAVGRTNGDLFSRVISYSAGFMPPYLPTGKPKFFMSHGLSDPIFDVTQTGEFISSQLIAAGYEVDYVEFDGGHEIPTAIIQQSLTWLAT